MDLEPDRRKIPWKHLFLYLIEISFVANIIFVDIFIARSWFFTAGQNQAATTKQSAIISITPSPTITPVTELTLTPAPTTKPEVIVKQVSEPQVKEYFVPLGTGQSSSNDWQDVAGATAYVDSTNYPHIKRAVFEVSVEIPNANESVQVRLFNKTDGHPVWYSDVSFDGNTNTPQLLVSQQITLDNGNKLYGVQMKTQLKSPAILNQARIHITLN